jgi:hypothetical protein
MTIKKNPITDIRSGSQPFTLVIFFEMVLRKMVITKMMKGQWQYGLPCKISLFLFFITLLILRGSSAFLLFYGYNIIKFETIDNCGFFSVPRRLKTEYL